MTQKNSTTHQTSPQDKNKVPPKINVGSIGAVDFSPRTVQTALNVRQAIDDYLAVHKAAAKQREMKQKKEQEEREERARLQHMLENGFPVPREVKLDGPVEIRPRGQKPPQL
jgi:hypothetical protein